MSKQQQPKDLPPGLDPDLMRRLMGDSFKSFFQTHANYRPEKHRVQDDMDMDINDDDDDDDDAGPSNRHNNNNNNNHGRQRYGADEPEPTEDEPTERGSPYHGRGSDDEASECIDVNDADAKFEKTINYRTLRFGHVDRLNGEHIRPDKNERKYLTSMQTEMNEKGATMDDGDGVAGNRGTYNSLGTSRFAKLGLKNRFAKEIDCVLCQNAKRFHYDEVINNAMDLTISYHFGIAAEVHDGQMWQDCADIFNILQEGLAAGGGKGFTVSTDVMRVHFTEHNVTNPLLPLVRNRRLLSDIIKKGKKHLFGRSPDGKSVWHTGKTNLLFKAMDKEKEMTLDIMRMKAFIDSCILKKTGTLNPGKFAMLKGVSGIEATSKFMSKTSAGASAKKTGYVDGRNQVGKYRGTAIKR